MDTPVGRATKASQWRYPYPPDPTDEQRATVVVSRLAFKAGAAWSRTDALHDLTVAEVEIAARALFEADRPHLSWDDAPGIARSRFILQARAFLSSFLTGRRAEG